MMISRHPSRKNAWIVALSAHIQALSGLEERWGSDRGMAR
jgi:hypothetical protein